PTLTSTHTTEPCSGSLLEKSLDQPVDSSIGVGTLWKRRGPAEGVPRTISEIAEACPSLGPLGQETLQCLLGLFPEGETFLVPFEHDTFASPRVAVEPLLHDTIVVHSETVGATHSGKHQVDHEDRRFLSGLVAQGKGLPSNTSARFVVTHGPAHGFLHEAECVQHVGFSRGVGTEDPGDRQRLPVRFFWGRVIVDG